MTTLEAKSGPSALICGGCGVSPDPFDPFPFTCPNAGKGDVDHVLRRVLDTSALAFPDAVSLSIEREPFVAYRTLLHSYHRALAGGISDEAFVGLVRHLDSEVAQVDGHGFETTPFRRNGHLSDALGFGAHGGIWVKDETGNVSGSHKGRHLFGVMLHLEVSELLGLSEREHRPRLAIASCGNAALAAAVVASAGRWALRVFVPSNADPHVLGRLRDLAAEIEVCARKPDAAGDPAYLRLLEDLADGAVPFTCQGNLNGLMVEGGETLGYEIAADLAAGGEGPLDHVVVPVGGGALASACAQAFDEAFEVGALTRRPRLHTVQTASDHPLERAYHLVRENLGADSTPAGVEAAIRDAAQHRSQYMWPWEKEPKSIATGILDDETYNWLAVVAAMLSTGGLPVVVSEERLSQAHELGRAAGFRADPTGTASLAGLLDLVSEGDVAPTERCRGALHRRGALRKPCPGRRASTNRSRCAAPRSSCRSTRPKSHKTTSSSKTGVCSGSSPCPKAPSDGTVLAPSSSRATSRAHHHLYSALARACRTALRRHPISLRSSSASGGGSTARSTKNRSPLRQHSARWRRSGPGRRRSSIITRPRTSSTGHSMSSPTPSAGSVRTGVLCYEVTDRDGAWRATAGIEENRRFLGAPRRLARGLIGAHASFTMSNVTLAACADAARELGAGIHIHVAEGGVDEDDSIARFGKRVVERLAECGVLDERALLAHCVHVNEREMTLVESAGATVVCNPRSNMNNGVGHSPFTYRAGRVALGTDGIGGDLIAEAQAGFFRGREADLGLSSAWPLERLAESQRLVGRVYGEPLFGTLRPGAPADLAVISYDPPAPLHAENLAGHFVFGWSSGRVRDVYVAGARVIAEGLSTLVDEAELAHSCQEAATRLWQRMETIPAHDFTPEGRRRR